MILVATDLISGDPIWFGNTVDCFSDGSVLEAVLASACLPPWMQPFERNGQLLVDGSVVSDLPIEPAVIAGATEIFALDLEDQLGPQSPEDGWRSLLNRVMISRMAREKKLEMSFASLHGTRVWLIQLAHELSIPFTNFQHTEELIQVGYEITRRELSEQVSYGDPICERSFEIHY